MLISVIATHSRAGNEMLHHPSLQMRMGWERASGQTGSWRARLRRVLLLRGHSLAGEDCMYVVNHGLRMLCSASVLLKCSASVLRKCVAEVAYGQAKIQGTERQKGRTEQREQEV